MSEPNRNTLWGRVIVEELARAGVNAVCVAPGSRSTPLVVACAEHPDVRILSHLDERSAAYFALGRAKRSGGPTPLVCTSGTAAANLHPAVIEADRSRVPMLLLTADRPADLRDSGANQTIDQQKLFGDAVRWYRELTEPRVDASTLRSLRTTISRAVDMSMQVPPGPVHLNVPFRKPLEPTPVPGDVPDDFADRHPRAATGRSGPYVRTWQGRTGLDTNATAALRSVLETAQRGLVVAGPSDRLSGTELRAFASRLGVPLLADPLSGARFCREWTDAPVVGGYDSFLDERVTDSWPAPDVVVRFGAAPTSTTLQRYLETSNPRQFVVDPAGEWREATFAATDLLSVDPGQLMDSLVDALEEPVGDRAWRDRFVRAENAYWELIDGVGSDLPLEGAILDAVLKGAPDPATIFVSNSMPVRDADRFGRPRDADLTVLGNRGASGIDGITSTALGAGSATGDPLVLVTGDLAYFHDVTGLLAVDRCDVDATIVLLQNDGGGIFHTLPIESHDPPFTDHFKTPHGLDFEPTGEVFGIDYERVTDRSGFEASYRESLERDGTQVVEVVVDAERNHRRRERVHERVCRSLS